MDFLGPLKLSGRPEAARSGRWPCKQWGLNEREARQVLGDRDSHLRRGRRA